MQRRCKYDLCGVFIMLDAVKEILDIKDEEIKSVRDYKMKRLLNRLKKGCDL